MVIILTDDNFKKEIAQGITLVDFWAPWCGPCRVQGPIVEDIAKQYETGGKVKVAKMNVDENPATSQEFGILSIPTAIVFKGGTPVAQLIGLQSKNTLTQKIQEQLGA